MTHMKEKALYALLTKRNKTEAAAACGITCRTLHNYLKDPEFIQAYNAAFGLMINKAMRKAQQSMEGAVEVLQEIAADQREDGATRVNAARSIIEYGLKLSEQSPPAILSGIEQGNEVLSHA